MKKMILTAKNKYGTMILGWGISMLILGANLLIWQMPQYQVGGLKFVAALFSIIFAAAMIGFTVLYLFCAAITPDSEY